MPGDSHIKVNESDGVHVVEFEDRKILDELSISETGDQLFELVKKQASIRLLLNFQKVEHLSSAALGMLITLEKMVKERKGKLRLSNIRPQIYEVFKITRLNKLFDIRTTAEEALAGL
jgi:anti-sigma B factor antagonist